MAFQRLFALVVVVGAAVLTEAFMSPMGTQQAMFSMQRMQTSHAGKVSEVKWLLRMGP